MENPDKIILATLQENASVGKKELGEQLSMSSTQVYGRIRKLEKSGIIKRYVALLDWNLLGKNILVFMNITLKDHHADARNEFVQKMEELEPVVEFYHTSGSFDFLIKVRFSEIKEFRDFLVNDLTCIPNIGNIESQIVLEEIKYSTKINL